MLLTIRAYTLYLTALYNVFIYHLIIIYVLGLAWVSLFAGTMENLGNFQSVILAFNI